MNVAVTEIGTVIAGMSVDLASPRNRKITNVTRITAMISVVYTSRIEASMKTELSKL